MCTKDPLVYWRSRGVVSLHWRLAPVEFWWAIGALGWHRRDSGDVTVHCEVARAARSFVVPQQASFGIRIPRPPQY